MKFKFPLFMTFLSVFWNFSCSSANDSLKISPRIGEQVISKEINEMTGNYSSRISYKNVVEEVPHEITTHETSTRQFSFQLLGNFKSSARKGIRFKKFHFQKNTVGDTLILKNTVELLSIFGKDAHNLFGYNYQIGKEIKVPKNIKFVQIELYEMHPTYPKDQRKPVLKSNKLIDLNQIL